MRTWHIPPGHTVAKCCDWSVTCVSRHLAAASARWDPGHITKFRLSPEEALRCETPHKLWHFHLWPPFTRPLITVGYLMVHSSKTAFTKLGVTAPVVNAYSTLTVRLLDLETCQFLKCGLGSSCEAGPELLVDTTSLFLCLALWYSIVEGIFVVEIFTFFNLWFKISVEAMS